MNPNCDRGKCTSKEGEVRILPMNGDAQAIVCQHCHGVVLNERRQSNRNLAPDVRWSLPVWKSLKVYSA